MREYIECRECGFVLVADHTDDATPLHWDACPACEGTEFGPAGGIERSGAEPAGRRSSENRSGGVDQ